MFCIAYPMRRDGRKLPPEEIRARGKRGWLTLARMPAGQPVWTAKLTGPNGGDVLPELTCATVPVISGGIVIRGFAAKPGGAAPERQAWYCVPVEMPEELRPVSGRPRDGRRG